MTLGASINPPTEITREFNGTIVVDTVVAVSALDHRVDSLHATGTMTYGGKDKMNLPWRGTVEMSIAIKDNLTVGLGFEVRPYRSAEYVDPLGNVSSPWLASSIFRVAAHYRAAEWLTLRAGVTTFDENFSGVTPALRGEPVSYPIYSLGCGVEFMGARVNVAYEYSDRKFVDAWSNAASINRQIGNTIVASVAYQLPALF